MTRRIVFRPEAETELTEAVDWYEARSQGLGAEFLRALDAVLAQVQRQPTLFRSCSATPGARHSGGFPIV
jgi:plasmid stabilization system protein ParE